MDVNYHLLFKILVVGNAEMGEAEILHPSVDDSLSASTIGVNFLKRILEIDGKKIKLQIWNITGQDSSQATTTSYYHDTHGFIIVYDVTEELSFKQITDWLTVIYRHANEKGFRKVLLAKQCNRGKTRKVTKQRGEMLARQYDMRYVESTDLEEAIKLLTKDILQKDHMVPLREDSKSLHD